MKKRKRARESPKARGTEPGTAQTLPEKRAHAPVHCPMQQEEQQCERRNPIQVLVLLFFDQIHEFEYDTTWCREVHNAGSAIDTQREELGPSIKFILQQHYMYIPPSCMAKATNAASAQHDHDSNAQTALQNSE